jgi:hypothetical protein
MLFTLKVSPTMTEFIIKKLPYDLSSHAGLAFIGNNLKSININALIDPAFPVRSGVANSAILKSYLGLLCLGKNDFDAIENFRDNAFFKRALGLSAVPSSPTLRQRLDANASSWFDLVPQMNQKLLASRINGQPFDLGALACGYTQVDLDTFAMDNSATKKELVGRTYAGSMATARLRCIWAVWVIAWNWHFAPVCSIRPPRANTTLSAPCLLPQVWLLRHCWCGLTPAFVL